MSYALVTYVKSTHYGLAVPYDNICANIGSNNDLLPDDLLLFEPFERTLRENGI